MTNVVLAGTLDTKGDEYAYVADHLRRRGAHVLLIDVGTRGTPKIEPDVTREQVAAAASDSGTVTAAPADSRAGALTAMAAGLSAILQSLAAEGRLHAVLGFGGSGALAVLAPAFRTLPLGPPKVIATTMAASDNRHVIDASDLILLPSVVDIAGLNSYTRGVLSRAADLALACVGTPVPQPGRTPMVAASMFGVTTVGIDSARRELERRGFDVLVFHANGIGGRALESLADQGALAGILDLTTTELADELLDGKAAADARRLRLTGRRGVPRVVSVGALDIANFGPASTLPPALADRLRYQHGPNDTLVRTSADECRQLGRLLAERLAGARGPVSVVLPTGGVSALSESGEAFCDPVADAALTDAVRGHLPARITVHHVDAPLNSETFGTRAAAILSDLIGMPDEVGCHHDLDCIDDNSHTKTRQ